MTIQLMKSGTIDFPQDERLEPLYEALARYGPMLDGSVMMTDIVAAYRIVCEELSGKGVEELHERPQMYLLRNT